MFFKLFQKRSSRLYLPHEKMRLGDAGTFIKIYNHSHLGDKEKYSN